MTDDFEREEELEEPLVTTEPVDRDSYVAVIHDSFGERYVNMALMLERAPTVSVLRVPGAKSLEPRGEVQYFVNGGQVSQDATVNPGDTLYIVGKLPGGGKTLGGDETTSPPLASWRSL